MKRHFLLLILAGLSVGAGAAGDEILVSEAELANLGVRLESPLPATAIAAVQATARVTMPPEGEAILNAAESGILKRVLVSAGDSVEAGEVLAELHSPGFLEWQRAFVDAVNTARLASANFERDQQLHAEGIISERRLAESRTAQRLAAAGLAEHRALLEIAGLRPDDISALETRQALQGLLKVRAPFAGEVIERHVTTGEYVDAMAPLFRLADLRELWLEIEVPQEQVAGVREGMRVTGAIDNFEARVSRVGRAVNSATQSVPVRAVVTAGAEALMPGQFLAVQFLQDEAKGSETRGWAVPAVALSRSGGTSVLFVRTAGGFEVRPVEILGTSREQLYVAGELSREDRIAVSSIPALKAIWAAAGD
jgi:cobalt-zinc-cadmium efflux system membrane fusion protein